MTELIPPPAPHHHSEISGDRGEAGARAVSGAFGLLSHADVNAEAIAQAVANLRAEIAQLQEAIAGRDVIGQAKGIIRLLTRTDGDAAFHVLSKMSQDTNRRLRDIAQLIADCAASGRPLPPDLSVSWRKRTGLPASGSPRAAGFADSTGFTDPDASTGPAESGHSDIVDALA